MYFLQTKVVETSYNVLLNYGAIGAILILCIFALVLCVRFFVKLHTKTTTRVDDLQKRVDVILTQDRERLLSIISDYSKSFQNLEKMLERFLDRE